jgi:hypothetical protein
LFKNFLGLSGDEDYAGASLPRIDALAIMLAIANNHKILRILVDNENSVGILYHSTFKHMKNDREKMGLARYPLMGFSGEQVLPVGSIELSITNGTFSRQYNNNSLTCCPLSCETLDIAFQELRPANTTK